MTLLRHVPRPAGALPPGSVDALRQGCTCPPVENHFGRGYETVGEPTYLVRDTCPVHGDGATPRALEPTDVGTYTAPLPTPRAKRVIAQPAPIPPRQRKAPAYRPKVCLCGATFTPTNSRQLSCNACRGAA